jgi:hypothetical protein
MNKRSMYSGRIEIDVDFENSLLCYIPEMWQRWEVNSGS